MATVRIYKIADVLNTTSDDVRATLKRDHGIEVRHASSTIEEVVARHFVMRVARERGLAISEEAIYRLADSYLPNPSSSSPFTRWRAQLEESSRNASGPAAPSSRKPDAENRPGLLFVCYRRDDSADAAGRLHDRLSAAFGDRRVFIDIDSVPLGIDFVDHVREQIARCSAVIVMMGRQWLTIQDKRGRRRLDNLDDLVRAEIAAALQQKIPVIPVIVQNAEMPSAEDLPDDIKLLARRNGIHLRPEQWKEGVDRLLRELEPIMKSNQ